MQSQLTRKVFRAILNSELLPSSQCRSRCIHTIRVYRPRRIVPSLSHVQRRGLFAFNFNPKAAAPPPATLQSEIGLKPMKDLLNSRADKSRGPSDDVLAKAFQAYFEARAEEPGVISQLQAKLLTTTWDHLQSQEEKLDPEDWQRVFSDDNLDKALYVLSRAKCLTGARAELRDLARRVFHTLCEDVGADYDRITQFSLLAYIEIQALNGNPDEARETVERFWSKLRGADPSPWATVMKGFALSDDRRRQAKWIAEKSNGYGVPFDPAMQADLVQYLIGRDNMNAVKAVYECPLSGGKTPSLSTKIAVLKYAIRKTNTAWAQPIFHSILLSPVSETLGVRLLWQAAEGKDASQVSKTLELLTVKNVDAKALFTTACLNDLIEYANSANSPQLASQFMDLASAWGIIPDTQTTLLRLESYIQAGNVGVALKLLASMDGLETTGPENLPLMNKLIKMLSLSSHDDAVFEAISFLLDPIFESNIRLEADTLAAITHMLLYRHDWEGASDLLRPRIATYDSEDRSKIRNSLTDFILDLSQESEHAWVVYELLRLAFPETGVRMRTSIMISFYDRNRSDQAFLVFGHMRQAQNFSQRPKPDTYARCFQGIARTQDSERLESVHNMLKLDTEVDLNTRLLNWLMFAYAVCDKPEKSMQIFRDILQSDEGPTPRTISLYFKVCAKHHNGALEAQKLISKVKYLGIPIDRHTYTEYVAALAAQCEFTLATEAMDAMEETTGYPPTATSIGYFYNCIPFQYWKDKVEKWAKDRYPQLWAQLEGIERTELEEGMGLMFKLKRNDIPKSL
ncbi:hypothetical protein BJY04DRAFT_231867 [Aspergillus karnatakaensis]|uniref:putative mitochondrial respiratory complex I chaperone (Cia84) n=1 Tax=Aspergillus karnatakaensis TaxID=1810916 RepID=UPI003CCDD57A